MKEKILEKIRELEDKTYYASGQVFEVLEILKKFVKELDEI